MTVNENNWKEFDNLLFSVRVSIRYHDHMQKHYIFWSVLIATAIVIGGGLIVALGTDVSKVTTASLFVLSSSGALVQLFRLHERYHSHKNLRQQFQKLSMWLKNVEVTDQITPDNIAEGNKRRTEIEVDEASVLRVLAIVCHNETVIALGIKDGRFYQIPWYRRLFCKFSDFGTHENFKLIKPPILITRAAEA